MSYIVISMKIKGGDREALFMQKKLQEFGAYDLNVRVAGSQSGGMMTGYQSNSSNPLPVLESAKSRAESLFRKKPSDLLARGPAIGTLKMKAAGEVC